MAFWTGLRGNKEDSSLCRLLLFRVSQLDFLATSIGFSKGQAGPVLVRILSKKTETDLEKKVRPFGLGPSQFRSYSGSAGLF